MPELRSLNDPTPDEVWRTDVAVVGSGVAGLATALGAASRSVLVLTKTTSAAGGSSPLAQGGVAAAWGDDDGPTLHADDTCEVGRGLSDARSVELLTGSGREAIEQLLRFGVPFDRDGSGRLALGREAGHRRRRILHAGGDATGREITRALVERVRGEGRIRVEEEVLASDLLLAGGEVVGVLAYRQQRAIAILASAVVLATGGIGQLFLRTTNPPEVTGDGLAMAARAGARLADLEMVQFHPTALAVGGGSGGLRMPLLTEALRGEGALLVDRGGRRFLLDVHRDAELAPRDVVARACWQQDREGGCFLDLRPLRTRLARRFPTVAATCTAAGLDPAREPVPVAPAAHYHMGGVLVDGWGRSSLPGLWVCGETASSGVHGANRLASNSLLEAFVFGGRVGVDVARRPVTRLAPGRTILVADDGSPPVPAGEVDPRLDALRRLMWERVGLERSGDGLRAVCEGLAELRRAWRPGPGEARNLLLVGQLVARAARERRESRGGHFRVDYPQSRDEWAFRLAVEPEPGSGAPRAFVPVAAKAAREVEMAPAAGQTGAEPGR